MEDILALKEKIEEMMKDLRRKSKDDQRSYEQYLELCQSMYSVFCQQMENVAEEYTLTSIAQTSIECVLKTAVIKRQSGDLTAKNICESSKKLLSGLKVEKKLKDAREKDIKDIIKSILNKKEKIDKNLFSRTRQFINRIIPAHFLGVEAKCTTCHQEHTDEILSELLGHLLQHMLSLHQHCEEFDLHISETIKELDNYKKSVIGLVSLIVHTTTSARDISPFILTNINTLRAGLLQVELKVKGLSKITPDLKKKKRGMNSQIK